MLFSLGCFSVEPTGRLWVFEWESNGLAATVWALAATAQGQAACFTRHILRGT